MSETIERVLFNPSNGKLAVGVRLRFMDKYPDEPLGKLGDYSLRIEPTGCDAWAIDNEAGIYILVPGDIIGKIEDLGEL